MKIGRKPLTMVLAVANVLISFCEFLKKKKEEGGREERGMKERKEGTNFLSTQLRVISSEKMRINNTTLKRALFIVNGLRIIFRKYEYR